MTTSDRDRDWILAIAAALGMNSGFDIPIVPQPNEFKRLFTSIRERSGKTLLDALEEIRQYAVAEKEPELDGEKACVKIAALADDATHLFKYTLSRTDSETPSK